MSFFGAKAFPLIVFLLLRIWQSSCWYHFNVFSFNASIEAEHRGQALSIKAEHRASDTRTTVLRSSIEPRGCATCYATDACLITVKCMCDCVFVWPDRSCKQLDRLLSNFQGCLVMVQIRLKALLIPLNPPTA